MKKNKRRIILTSIIMLIGVGAFFWLRSYVFANISARIDEKISSMKLSGFNVRYDSLSVDWRTNVIIVENLVLEKNAYDTACVYPEFIAVGKIRAEGLRLWPLIFNNILSFEDLSLEKWRMVMRQNSQLFADSSSEREKDFTLRADRVSFKSADLTYTDSSQCDMITGIKSDITIEALALSFPVTEPFSYEVDGLSLGYTEVKLPQALYTFKIRETKLDLLTNVFRADSIQVIPDAGKFEFSRKLGYETDRFDALIPFVRADNVFFSFNDSSQITAGFTEIQIYLKVFRDKRLPFVKKNKLLPIAQLQDLPFDLLIDSLKVTKSYVEYEEFAEGSAEAGKVYFDNLYATITNINNSSTTGNTQMRAQANLVGQGNVKLFVTFPLNTDKTSQLAGSIVDFRIPEINPMLTPATNIKVESGKMEKLTFRFSFNETRSDGELELNYHDLKLAIFKDEGKKKEEELEKDNLKTFIMNTFIFRTNMDEDVPQDKRTGTIAFVRDDNRSVFNFWVKSLVSGIKSAYNLDKAEAKIIERDEKREDKKEQRLTKREARKLKRTDKKKDRG